MQNTPDGGPAFPLLGKSDHERFDDMRGRTVIEERLFTSGGMTLRDYFAAKAMSALIPIYVQGDPDGWKENISATAYRFADQMLSAREAK